MLIPTLNVARVCNPLLRPPWTMDKDGPILHKEIETAIPAPYPFSDNIALTEEGEKRTFHVGRIKYLAQKGWNDPIVIDVGSPALHCFVEWPVRDGNHRLAAALYLNEPHILVAIGGDLEYFAKILRVDYREVLANCQEEAV